ncbi:MAG: VTT domain-containing protein, partial [Pseudobdellovibrionaceae bacterium]|nr:VTT domain-containing protein [Pseudobdellovibrionaceae bacterium]
ALRFGWFSHARMHFKMDAAHPVGASQHQKFVVVDQSIAFLGGLDLTIRRWDTCEHLAKHPLRVDPQGQSYGPYHDMQIGFNGSLARRMADLFCERWKRATGEELVLNSTERDFKPRMLPGIYAFEDVSMALSQTVPSFRNNTPSFEIAQLYQDCLEAAQHHVVLENQYLTSRHIVEILSRVLQKTVGPEVVIILPELAGGWLEQKTMGLMQAQALYTLKQSDTYGRLQVFFPAHRELEKTKRYITVHSKVMVVDSHVISVGSANLNNRSMGFDSEVNATLQLQKPCYGFTAHLLSHHTEAKATEIERLLERGGSLKEAIEVLNSTSTNRFLHAFSIHSTGPMLLDSELVDAEKPSVLEEGMDRWSQLMQILSRRLGLSSPKVMFALGFVLLGLFLFGLYMISRKSPIDYYRLLAFFRGTEEGSWLRHGLIPLTFAIGGLFFVPINIMILATAAILPLDQAVMHIVLGVVANVSTSYVVGHAAGRYFFRRFFGGKVRNILKRVGNGHFLTLVALRIVPVAPNSLINLTAGVGHVPFLRFLGATLVGMTPGLLLLVVFQKSLFSVLEKPAVVSVVLLVALVVFALLLAQWSLRRFSHYGRS